jgi:hypothetical protein
MYRKVMGGGAFVLGIALMGISLPTPVQSAPEDCDSPSDRVVHYDAQCNEAHADPPQLDEKNCTVTGGQCLPDPLQECVGSAWGVAVPGACVSGGVGASGQQLNCTANYGVTNVDIYNYNYKCTVTLSPCNCYVEKKVPEDKDTIEVCECADAAYPPPP